MIIITLHRLTCKGDIQPKHKQDKQMGSEIHLTINLKHYESHKDIRYIYKQLGSTTQACLIQIKHPKHKVTQTM